MDIERIGGTRNKVTFNHNRERILFEFIPPLLGWGSRLRFAWQRTFSEDLSENPLTITLGDTAAHGLHQAIQQRITSLQDAHPAGSGYQTPESVTLNLAINKLAEVNAATGIQEAA